MQSDGLHIGNDLVLVTALDIDGNGDRHPLGLVERATENTAVVQALIDNLIERGLDPTVCRLFIIDGAKALSKVIRRTFGGRTAIHRCQLHQATDEIDKRFFVNRATPQVHSFVRPRHRSFFRPGRRFLEPPRAGAVKAGRICGDRKARL